MNQKNSQKALLPLFLIIFIDGMGLGLLFPVLTSIIIDVHQHFLPGAINLASRELLYGLLMGSFMICWFFGATILGDLSDKIGRKKGLSICLIGTFIGYLLSALAIIFKSFVLLYISRVIAGFTAGGQPIAQAAIIDISSDEQSVKNFGYILLAVSLGFIFGPILGGILSNSQFLSHFDFANPWLLSKFNFATPFYFAAALSFINVLLLHFLFHETMDRTNRDLKIKLSHAVKLFTGAFTHKSIGKHAVIFLVFIYGWSNYFTFVPMYLFEVYQYTTLDNSLFLSVLGLGFLAGSFIGVNYFAMNYRLDKVVIAGLILCSVSVFLTLITKSVWISWMAAFFIGAGMCTVYSILLVIFSNLVSSREQGWVMGVTGSIMALCFGITDFVTGYLAREGADTPIALSTLGFLLCTFLYIWLRYRKIKGGMN